MPTSLALCFFFNDTATTEIYTLSLHDALPIWPRNQGDLDPSGLISPRKVDLGLGDRRGTPRQEVKRGKETPVNDHGDTQSYHGRRDLPPADTNHLPRRTAYSIMGHHPYLPSHSQEAGAVSKKVDWFFARQKPIPASLI